MFQFSRLPSDAYVFSVERCRITSIGFSHSEIRGSKAVQRLTAAYRSRPRPSSAPGAKASTMCSYYLDGEPALARRRSRDDLPFYCGLGAVFKLLRGPQGEGIPHPRSLRTEQRARRSHRAREPGRHRDQIRSTFWGTGTRDVPALLG